MKHFPLKVLLLSLLTGIGEALANTSPPTFQLPTFKEQTPNFKATQAPILPDPHIDIESIYQAVVSCYPTPSRFDLDGFTSEQNPVFQNPEEYTQSFHIGEYGNYYFGVVGAMPLVDDSEVIDRQRTREYTRRKDTATLISSFTKAIAKRNHAEREIGLYAALERRSQVRVQKGIIGVAEQIGHLESVISAQRKFTEAKAEVLQTRLALAGQCKADFQPAVNAYLKQIEEWRGG